MIGKGANEIRPATLVEVAKILEKRQGTAGEFGFEQQTTLDYARKFARLRLSDAQELAAELEKLEVKPETAVKLADILPLNGSQLALILSKDRSSIPDKKVSEIEELISKYAKKARKIEGNLLPPPEAKPSGEPSAGGPPPGEPKEEGEGKE